MAHKQKQKSLAVEKILKISAELFENYGYQETSTRMIAKELGMSNGAIFVHFKTKLHILAKLYESKMIVSTAKGFKAASNRDDIKDKVSEVYKARFRLFYKHPDLSREILKGLLFNAQEENKSIEAFTHKVADEILINNYSNSRIISSTIFSVYLAILLKDLSSQKPSTKKSMTEFKEHLDLILN